MSNAPLHTLPDSALRALRDQYAWPRDVPADLSAEIRRRNAAAQRRYDELRAAPRAASAFATLFGCGIRGAPMSAVAALRDRFDALDAEVERLGTAADGSQNRGMLWDLARLAGRRALRAIEAGAVSPLGEFERAVMRLAASRRHDAADARRRASRHREELVTLDLGVARLSARNARLTKALMLGAVADSALDAFEAQIGDEYIPRWRWELGSPDSAVAYPRDAAEMPVVEALHRYRCEVMEAGILESSLRLADPGRPCTCGAPYSAHGRRVGAQDIDGDARCPKTTAQLVARILPIGIYQARTFVDATVSVSEVA